MRRSRTYWVLRALLAMLSVYILLLAILVFKENDLVYPAPRYPAGNWSPSFAHEDVEFVSDDGTRLHGWFLEHPQPRATILFCHGNAEHVASAGAELAWLREQLQVAVFLFDYRGYGRSEGSPHEEGVLQDGQAAFEWLRHHPATDANQIIVVGRSLGGAVAVDLASTRPLAGVVIQSTFSRLPDAAARQYPFVPVRFLMQNRYDSVDKIQLYDGPLLHVHGEQDRVVPFDLGQQLHAACPSRQKEFLPLSSRGHNNIRLQHYASELNALITKSCDRP